MLRACRLLSTLTYSMPAIGHTRGQALNTVYRAVLEARYVFFGVPVVSVALASKKQAPILSQAACGPHFMYKEPRIYWVAQELASEGSSAATVEGLIPLGEWTAPAALAKL